MTRKVKAQHRVSNFDPAALKRRIREQINNGYLPKHRQDGTFKKSRLHKYNARGRWIGDRWFASKAEADRYEQLLELLQQGRIDRLECQVPFPCVVMGQLVCTYLADFRYRIHPGRLGQRTLVEDVKGMVTDEYKIKRKLVRILHAIEIIELKVPKRGGMTRFRFLTGDEIHLAPKEEVDESTTQAGPADSGAQAEDSPARDGERAAEGGT